MTYGMLIDLKKCVGCHACSVACKEAHGTRPGVRRSRVDRVFEGTYPDVRKTAYPMLCMHCETAPCVEVCPQDATYKREDGIVVIDKGVIVANEKTEDLINAVEGSRRLIAKIVGPEDEVLKMLRATPGVKYAELLGRRDTDSFSYMLESEDKVDIRKPLFYNLARSGWPLIGLEGMELNIEDIFIRLIDRDKEKAKKGAKKGGNKQ